MIFSRTLFLIFLILHPAWMNKIVLWSPSVLLQKTNEQSVGLKSHAVFFAVDEYSNEAIPNLKNPIEDARKIAAELQAYYGFTTQIIENPTLADIEKQIFLLGEKYKNGVYHPEEQLLLFFTGHGAKKGNLGYFLPADADPDIFKLNTTALAYSIWRNDISAINCKHILVAIDACFSGMFDPDYGSRSMGKRYNEVSDEEKIILNHKNFKTRKFLTSGTDVKTPDDSRFVYYFLEGLRINRGLMTVNKLFTHLEKARPSPLIGKFEQDDPTSNFLFVRESYQPRQQTLEKQDGSSRRYSDVEAWAEAKKADTRLSYEKYLNLYPNGLFQKEAEGEILRFQAAIDEDKFWLLASDQEDLSLLEKYRQEYPNGQYYWRAETQIRKLKTLPLRKTFSEMAFIEGGAFSIGCVNLPNQCQKDNIGNKQVSVSDFYMDTHEVTNEQFAAFLADYGSERVKSGEYRNEKMIAEHKFGLKKSRGYWSAQKGYEEHPVVNVSWFGANEYAKFYDLRLPTETEWEYAARGGLNSRKLDYAGADLAENTSWHRNNAGGRTHEVGQKIPNELNLYDLSGNIQEWTNDWYDKDYYKRIEILNPQGPLKGEGRVLRGGSWFQDEEYGKVAVRNHVPPNYAKAFIGFRCVKTP